ncbi:transcriptional regulator [Elasticomyces elasticus]|nr:transcriptional regulator [Elasticomyces elasticus]
MASVQTPAAPPQQPVPVMPPNMTKEQMQQAYVKWTQMKNSGVSETDPEFIKLRNLMFVLQRSQHIMKQRLAYQRQQQLAQQQQQQNGAVNAAPNSTAPAGLALNNGQPATNGQANGSVQSPVQNAAQQPQLQQPSQVQTIAVPNVANALLTKDQATLLQNQLSSFQRLAKGQPIPLSVQQQIFASQQAKKSPTPNEALVAASQALDSITKQPSTSARGNLSITDGSRHRFKTFTDPRSKYLDQTINFADHGRREKRLMIPSLMPLGVDVDRVREERENIVYNRIVARKSELENLPATIGSWNSRSSDTPEDDGKLKLKALIEYKMLCLLPRQRALRQSIGREMVQSDNLAMTANRSMYRRMKKQSLREARITEKLEKQQRDAQETKERKRHTDFLRSIESRAQELQEQARNHKARIHKFGRMMVLQHQQIEKEEQKRVERTAKQRLQALRANDEETYLKLLGQAKDSRISHLLKQTDGFLNQLAASVKAQQRGARQRYGDRDLPEESDHEDEEGSEDEGGKKVDYYEVAHRIKETVPVQSSNLVGGTLKEYQLKGLQWMLSLYNNNLNGILADEMGLGKTIQTISLITYLIEKKQQPGPYLVIVPLSTLTNWNSEFEKWAPTVQRIVYKGPPTVRKQQQQQIRYGHFQVLLTTYEFIVKDRPILSKVKWMHMIVDEGHRMKNAKSKLSSTITQYYNTRYRLILTGTPLQNNLPELWALLNFVLPTIFKSVKSFDEWFNTPFANTGGGDKMELTEEEQLLVIRRLHKVLRPFLLRRLKKDVEKDLPDKQERVIKCNFSALQAKLYKQLVTNNRLTVSDGKGGKTSMRGLSNMLMQLRKLCNHPFVFEEVEDQMNPGRTNNDLLWRTAGKFELLDRVLPKFQATGHRVLMFFQMTQIMNIMEDFLRLRGIEYLRLDGSTKSDDRSELLKQFNAPNSKYFCFLLSTRAGGLGLNLQTADTVIIYDSDWNPHQDLQAQDRAHRIGQKNEVRILRLISSNSVEEKILERAQFKLDMDGKVIQAGKFDNKSTNEERDDMLRMMLESAEAAESLEQDEMDDEDLNLIMMRHESELAVFQEMDEQRAKTQPYGPGKKYPRLLSEEELPDLYLNDDVPVLDEIQEVYGRGVRERTKVKYDDGLTEEQWLEAVDNDEDTVEAAIARKEGRVSRRAVNKEKRLRNDFGVGETPPASRDSSESPQPKKRGRKPRAEKRKADEISLDGDVAPPPKKRGRQTAKVVETLSPSERSTLQEILESVHATLSDLEEVSKDPKVPNRGIIDPFINLPSKIDYPDYYQLIKQPICIGDIVKKINRKQYQNLKQFRNDFGLLCNNCRQFNEDGSVLFKDANNIEVGHTCPYKPCLGFFRLCELTLSQATVVRRLREETEEHPELQDWDDQTSSMADGTSTRPISSVGTPLANN